MKRTTSRRAILAGIAASPALATPAHAAIGSPSPIDDPIFAAIEKHKVAFRASQVTGDIKCNTVDAKWAPEYDPVECKAVQEAASAADDAADDAANALTTIRPTTIAGLLALMHHVEQFNAGAFVLEIDPDGWYSKPMHWPANVDEDEIDLFGYSILTNVARALEAMTVQS